MINEYRRDISIELRKRLADIGPCVNGPASAYTNRRSVYIASEMVIPCYFVDSLSFLERVDFFSCIFESMVRNIDSISNISIRNPDVLYPIMFRGLDINLEDGKYRLYVRCITEDMEKPELSNPTDKISNALSTDEESQ